MPNSFHEGLFSTTTGASVSKTTAWRRRKKKFEEDLRAAAKAEGLPSPKKQRMVYTCKTCNQPQSKETGHSQYFGQKYCPNASGQIPLKEWLEQKAAERAARKATSQ